MSSGQWVDTYFGHERIVFWGFGSVPKMSKYNKAPTRKIERYIRDVLMENFGRNYFKNHRLTKITYMPETGVMLQSYGNYHRYYYEGNDGKQIVVSAGSDSDYSNPTKNPVRSNDVIFEKEKDKLTIKIFKHVIDDIVKWQLENDINQNKSKAIEEVKIKNVNIGDKLSFGNFEGYDFVWTIVDKKDGVLTLCSDYTFRIQENNGFRRRVDSYFLNEYFTDDELKEISWTEDDCKFYVDYVEKYESAFKNKEDKKVLGCICRYDTDNISNIDHTLQYGRKDYLYGEKGKYKNTVLCCDEDGNIYDAYNDDIPKRLFVNIKPKKVKRIKDINEVETLKFNEYNDYIHSSNNQDIPSYSIPAKEKYMYKWRNEYSQIDTRDNKKIKTYQICDMILQENNEYKYIDRNGKEQKVLDFTDENIKNLKAGDLIHIGVVDDKKLIFRVRNIANDIATLDSVFSVNLKNYGEILNKDILIKKSSTLYFLRDEIAKILFRDEELKYFIKFNNDDVIANINKLQGLLPKGQDYYVIFNEKAIETNENKMIIDNKRKEIKEVYNYCDTTVGNTNNEIVEAIPKYNLVTYLNIEKFLPTIKMKLKNNIYESKYTYLPDLDALNYYEKVIKKNKDIYYLINNKLYCIKDYNDEKIVEKDKIKLVTDKVKMIMINNGNIYYLNTNNKLYYYNDTKNESSFIMDSVYELFKLDNGNICFYTDVNDDIVIKEGENLAGIIYKYENGNSFLIDSFENEKRVESKVGNVTFDTDDPHYYNKKNEHSYYVNKYNELVSVDEFGKREVIDENVSNYLVTFSDYGIAYNKFFNDNFEAYYYNLNEVQYIKEGKLDFDEQKSKGYFGVYEETGKGKTVLEFIDIPPEIYNMYISGTPAPNEEIKLYYDIFEKEQNVQVYYNVLYYMSEEGVLNKVDDYIYGLVDYYEDDRISYRKITYEMDGKKSLYDVYKEMKTKSPFSLDDGKKFLEEYRSIIRKIERKIINR